MVSIYESSMFESVFTFWLEPLFWFWSINLHTQVVFHIINFSSEIITVYPVTHKVGLLLECPYELRTTKYDVKPFRSDTL